MTRSVALPSRKLIVTAVLLSSVATAQTAPLPPIQDEAPDIVVIGRTPLLGSGIDRDKVPAETHVLDARDIDRQGAPDALGALDREVPGLHLDDSSGNPEQPALFYHGFAASPLQGTEEGIAVYLNGVRFNQAFGDTIDWEVIPNLAIRRINVEGANPAFGLNAIGGSIGVQLQDGFAYQGTEADLSGGSFGQVVGNIQYGVRDGTMAAYVAGSVTHQDGWRDLQSSDVQNFYGDLGWRTDRAEAHVNLTLADSVLNGPGTSPVEWLAVNPAAQFTAPNIVANRYLQAVASGSYEVSDTTSVQGNAYYTYLLQHVVNGNTPSDGPCNNGSGLLCDGRGNPSTTRGGALIPDFLNGGPYSELDRQTTNTNGFGGSAQVTDTGLVFGLKNHFVAGLSYDGAKTQFGVNGTLGGLSPDRVFIGPGVVIDEPGQNVPSRLGVTNDYFGAFLSDTFEVTDRWALSASGRFNAAQVNLSDEGGGALSGNHTYNRFNPAFGATYRAASWLTAYAGYSESNRAPTPAELSCASATASCSLANFFSGDPNLKQVVGRSIEAGLRGTVAFGDGRKLTYDASLYRTALSDDIAFVNVLTLGRAYFQNVGQTLRQGADFSLRWKSARWLAYADYSYIEATYRSGFTETAGNNPAADANGNIAIASGNRLPGIPANMFKLGAYYDVTDDWTVGAAGLAESGTYLFGDPSNLNARLPSFFRLDLNTKVQLTPHVQLFALVSNVTNARYYTFGTFSPTASVAFAQAPNASNPRAYSPAAPVGGFGGVKVTF